MPFQYNNELKLSLIDWCLTPTLAVVQQYRGLKTN
jgi:hypothetical protein